MDVTPAQLYAIEQYEEDFEIGSLWGRYYNHVPEIEDYYAHRINFESIKNEKRIVRRILKHVNYDARRYWEIATVWFDGNPVMVTKNASREGDDNYGRYVTDLNVYGDMVRYLFGKMMVEDGLTKVVGLNDPQSDILHFYRDTYQLPGL